MLENDFKCAVKSLNEDAGLSKTVFEDVLKILRTKSCNLLSSNELRMLALSNMYLFQISKFRDLKRAEEAIRLFELFLSKYGNDLGICESYILTLELTYQYEKANERLMAFLNDPQTESIALKFLSSYTYCANGLQSYDDYVSFKKIYESNNAGDKVNSTHASLHNTFTHKQ